jgi:hypothetical protein
VPYPKISPAPNWTSIFSVHPELDPPGFAQAFIETIENPRIKPSEIKKEQTKEKKKKRALGRHDKR